MDGRPLFTGDIVIVFTVREAEPDCLDYFPEHLTAIVRNEFKNWSNSEPELLDEPSDFFAMGIRSTPLGS